MHVNGTEQILEFSKLLIVTFIPYFVEIVSGNSNLIIELVPKDMTFPIITVVTI